MGNFYSFCSNLENFAESFKFDFFFNCGLGFIDLRFLFLRQSVLVKDTSLLKRQNWRKQKFCKVIISMHTGVAYKSKEEKVYFVVGIFDHKI